MLSKVFAEDDLEKYDWLIPNKDIGLFIKKRVIKSIAVSLILGIVGVLMLVILKVSSYKLYLLLASLVALVGFIYFKIDYWGIKSKFNQRREEVYRVFPLWVSTLEILTMTNNIPNTFKKSLSTCPEAIKEDLEKFIKDIEYNPENKECYKNFLKKYDIPDVNEIIMDIYSFNRLNKDEIVAEFKNLNKRLNKIASDVRKRRQTTDLFVISSLNSIPLFGVSVYVLLISMLITIG